MLIGMHLEMFAGYPNYPLQAGADLKLVGTMSADDH
jgi:hypothetical protein